jgi:4-amino-4-deoxy-L-arabinose transferase-like glycosyltransferase
VAALSPKRDFRAWFWIILAVGFVLRVAWVLAVPVHPVSDSSAYDQLAWSIASRGTYAWKNGDLTAYWPVGAAFAYSIPYRLFGQHYAPLAALNVIAGTLSLALIMVLARRWTSSAAALAAGLVYAVWPSQIEFSSVLASELLFNLLLLLSLWAGFVAPIRSWAIKGLVAGIFLAGAAYVRPTALPLVILLAAGLYWSRRTDWRQVALFSAAALVAMAICITPWTLRNDRVLGAPVLISTNGPPNMWMGNNPDATGAYMALPNDVSGMSEVERSRLLGSRARAFVAEHPARALGLFVRKLVISHDRETIGITWNEESLGPALGGRAVQAAKLVSTAYWLLVLMLAGAGAAIVLVRERWRGLIHPALLAWAYFALVHAATVGADRYHFPSIPFIAILAGVAIARFARVESVDKTALNPKTL